MICAPPWQGRVEMTRGLMRRYRAMRQPWRGYRPTLVATIGETWCAPAENRCGSFGNVGVIRPEVLARVHQQQKPAHGDEPCAGVGRSRLIWQDATG